jgi:hypothetical protein
MCFKIWLVAVRRSKAVPKTVAKIEKFGFSESSWNRTRFARQNTSYGTENTEEHRVTQRNLLKTNSVALCLCHASFLKDDGRPIGNAVQAGLSNRPTLLGP